MIVSRSSYRGSIVIELNNKNVIMTSCGNIWCGLWITIYTKIYFYSALVWRIINNYLRLKIRVVWKEFLPFNIYFRLRFFMIQNHLWSTKVYCVCQNWCEIFVLKLSGIQTYYLSLFKQIWWLFIFGHQKSLKPCFRSKISIFFCRYTLQISTAVT